MAAMAHTARMISGRRIAEFPRTWTTGTRATGFSNASLLNCMKRESDCVVATRAAPDAKRFRLTDDETAPRPPRSHRQKYLRSALFRAPDRQARRSCRTCRRDHFAVTRTGSRAAGFLRPHRWTLDVA